MKCILCKKVLRGAGSLLLGKHCACSPCVTKYEELRAMSAKGDLQATRWVGLVSEKVYAYDAPPVQTTGPLGYAEKNWKTDKE